MFSRVRIGIITLPIDEHANLDEEQVNEQHFCTNLKEFLEVNGQAICAPLRYDLSKDPDALIRTLDCLDGVFLGGGLLSTRYLKHMPPRTLQYYKTVKEIVKYSLEHKLPMLCVCQGF